MSHRPRITRSDAAFTPVLSRAELTDLVSRVRPFVVAVAHKVASNPADAEEIAQESLLAVVRSIDRFEARCSLETWVYTLVRSEASRRFRRMRPLPMSAVSVHLHDRSDPHHDPSRWELRYDLERALSSLSELDRTILVQRDADGRHAHDVAAQVGLSVPALKSRLHRARISVRTKLTPPFHATSV